MSDWQVGDNAACIAGGRITRTGTVYTVSDISHPGDWRDGYVNRSGMVILRFAGLPHLPDGWADASRFRKIRPDEHEACEEEFVTLLKRSRKTVPASEWLLGLDLEYLKGLNAESLGDCADAHRRHSAEPEPVSRLRPPGECQHIARRK